MALWKACAGKGKERICDEIVEEDNVDDGAEEDPDVVVERAGLEIVILLHLCLEVGSDPLVCIWVALLVKPSLCLYRLCDPAALRLELEDVTESCIVGCPPKYKIEEEEDFGYGPRKKEEEDDLESKRSNCDEVEGRLGFTGIEDGSEYVRGVRDDEGVAVLCGS